MKIAVAAESEEKNSVISDRAGRASYYLIFDNSEEITETIKNPFGVGGGGAGFAVVKMLVDKGVDLIIAGKFGPNMIGAMEERGLKHQEATGVVEEVIEGVLKK